MAQGVRVYPSPWAAYFQGDKSEVITMPGKKRLRLSSSRDIRQSLNRIANMLLNDELDPKTANAIMYACSISLNAIRVDEQQTKLDELERLVEEVRNKQ